MSLGLRSVTRLRAACLVGVLSSLIDVPIASAQLRFTGVRRVIDRGYSFFAGERFRELTGELVSDGNTRQLRFDSATSVGAFVAPPDQLTHLRYEEVRYPHSFGRRQRSYLTVHYTSGNQAQFVVLQLPLVEAAQIVGAIEQDSGLRVDRRPSLTSFAGVPLYVATGRSVLITTQSGEKVNGRVADLSASAIALEGSRRFDQESVHKIELNDPIWNGAVGGGVISYLALSPLSWCGVSHTKEGLCSTAVALGVLVAGPMAGALIDRAVRRDAYDRTEQRNARSLHWAPVLTDLTQGVYLQLRF